jgi:hypothetical protein
MTGIPAPTLCGNCGTNHARALDSDRWVTVTDWRRDVLCPRCQASYTWLTADWHILMTHDGRLLGYVRRGALEPGRSVIMHTAFSGDIAGEIVEHHTNTPGGEWNGVTSVRTTVAVPGYRSAGQVYDIGTITLEPVPDPS